MTGRARLPGGSPRKASQRNTRRAAPVPIRVTPSWRPGDKVRWKNRDGIFRRDIGDGEHAEVAIGERVYRIKIGELA
jgi:hypothetical protein